MDGEGSRIDGIVSLNDFALVIDENQIRDPDLTEVDPEWIDPEMVRFFGIARGDVSRHSLIETEPGKQSKRRSQSLFMMQTLLLDARENRRLRKFERSVRSNHGRFC